MSDEIKPLIHVIRKEGVALCGVEVIPTGTRVTDRHGNVVAGIKPIDVCVFCAVLSAGRRAMHNRQR